LNTERRAWLAELYESNLSPVFKTCCSVLRNPDDAADASQEVFLIAADSLRPGTSRAAASAWLQTVARNHSLDVLRRRKQLGRALVTLGADGESGADPATGVADRDFVSGIFKKLSPRERQALWQSAVEHRPIDDIAGQLRLSYVAAAQVIHRARRRALALAARVVIVFGILRLGRRAGRIMPMLARVAAVPIILVSVISIQTSGTPATAAIAAGSAVPLAAVHPAQAGATPGGIGSVITGVLPGGATLPPGLVPSNPTSPIKSAVNAVRQSIDQVPGFRGTLPVPALPVTSPIPKVP
jgi:RNA polymerase sigma factor (sigma-70 family)